MPPEGRQGGRATGRHFSNESVHIFRSIEDLPEITINLLRPVFPDSTSSEKETSLRP